MSVTADANDFQTAPAANPYRLDWGRAFRAMKKLIADKEDTTQVFEIMDALSGKATPKSYLQLLSTPEGGRMAYEHKELSELLGDNEYLARLPAGSVGATYYKFITTENISAAGLAEESRKVHGDVVDSRHPYSWYGRRMRDVHDIWHVLTGYGRDAMGEACLVAFSYPQTKQTGFGFIAVMGGYQIARQLPGRGVVKAIWQAYRAGKNAAWLPGVDYEKLLNEPLDAARARLNIPRPTAYLAIGAEDRLVALAAAA